MRRNPSGPVTFAARLRVSLKYFLAMVMGALLAVLIAELPRKKMGGDDHKISSLQALKEKDRCNAILAISPDLQEQMVAVGSMPERGPLHGISVLVKDNIDIKGMPTTAGSRALLENFAKLDSPVVANLRRGGALIAGKTNLSEWANFRSTKSTSGWSSVCLLYTSDAADE